jgi:hypothetical protein
MSQPVLDQVGWRPGQPITVSVLKDLSSTLLFRPSEPDTKGYILSYLNRNRNGVSGGKISCSRIVGDIMSTNPGVSTKKLMPIYLNVEKKTGIRPYQIALLLANPPWLDVKFTATSAESFSPQLMGVYQVIGPESDQPLRIGQGIFQQRFQENLKIPELRSAKYYQYLPMSNKTDMVLLEHILLQKHKQENGQLPPGNKITA